VFASGRICGVHRRRIRECLRAVYRDTSLRKADHLVRQYDLLTRVPLLADATHGPLPDVLAVRLGRESRCRLRFRDAPYRSNTGASSIPGAVQESCLAMELVSGSRTLRKASA
jgi:hypothetical protein